jgi:hypothetical protein
MTVDGKHLTYEAYLAPPEIKARYSIVDGEFGDGSGTDSRAPKLGGGR